MKKNLLSLALLLTTTTAFCQENTEPVLTKSDYLRKSRSAKTAGWILMGSGVGMFAGSLATYKSNFTYFDLSPPKVDNTTSAMLAIGGACAVIGSIISFSASKQHKKKAAALTFGNQTVPVLGQNGLVSQLQPAVRLRVPL
jgi:predicted MFS family arabinose efflux permease